MDQVTLPRATVQQALEALEYENSWHAHHKVKPYASTIDAITALKAAVEQPEPCDPGSVPVKRSRMEALSKALGHPTQLAVADGDTAEDALVELAASRLEQSQKEPVAIFDAELRAWRV